MAQILSEPTDYDGGFHAAREGAIDRIIDSDARIQMAPGRNEPDLFRWPLPNVWLGTAIESDKYAFRADHLRGTPAAVRFLSLEPLLGPLPSLDLTGIDWVIVGGESGPHARPMHPDWARDIRDRCVELGIPYFFKQWGRWVPHHPCMCAEGVPVSSGGRAAPRGVAGIAWMHPVGKAKAGRLLDGDEWNQFPKATT